MHQKKHWLRRLLTMNKKYLFIACIFASTTCYADSDAEINEVCQDVASNAVSRMIYDRASGADKSDARQKFQRYNKSSLSRVYDLLLKTLDEVYKTSLSILDSDYLEKSISIQDKFTDSCVKVVSDYVEQEKQQARKTVITVQVDTGRYVKKFSITPTNGVSGESSTTRRVQITHPYGVPAGHYPYLVEYDKGGMCTGTVYIDGKSNYVIMALSDFDCKISSVIGS